MVPVNIQYREAELRRIFEDAAFACVLLVQNGARILSGGAEILPSWR